MTDLFDTLAAKGVTFLDRAGPDRVVGRHDTDLVTLTKDGSTELWRHPLPNQDRGHVVADEQTIFWNWGQERWSAIALAASDGRQLYALDGEFVVWLDGDRFLARNSSGPGTGSLRRTGNGELIASLPGLSANTGCDLSPDRRFLVTGLDPAQVWDLDEAKLRLSFESAVGANLEFTPDGARLIVTIYESPQSGMTDEVTERTFDLRSGSLVGTRTWQEHQ